MSDEATLKKSAKGKKGDSKDVAGKKGTSKDVAGKKATSKDVAGKKGDSKDVAGKKGGFPAKAGGEGKPGIIASILEFLTNATPEKPLSKKACLAKLKVRFPDRPETAMQNTVNIQLPARLAKDKGLNIIKTPNGYYIKGAEKSNSPKDKKGKKGGK